MDLTAMRNQLLKCDMDKTFAFISYSSEDKESVWADVIELQRRGYNLWIDEANLDKSKDSWKEDALSAIEDYDCELVVFYVSKHSLTSSSCLNELKKTTDEMTVKSHFDKVDFVAVEVESIDNIGVYMRTISKEIRSSDLERNEKKQRTYIFNSDFYDLCLSLRRLLSRLHRYCGTALTALNQLIRLAPLSSERQYRNVNFTDWTAFHVPLFSALAQLRSIL